MLSSLLSPGAQVGNKLRKFFASFATVSAAGQTQIQETYQQCISPQPATGNWPQCISLRPQCLMKISTGYKPQFLRIHAAGPQVQYAACGKIAKQLKHS